MPGLCPAVVAMTGHSLDKAGAAATPGRSVFAPGRSGLVRTNGGSGRVPKAGPAPFVDRETGSRWDIAGRAVEGGLKGWTLTWLDGTQVRWFAWAAEHPETSVYGD